MHIGFLKILCCPKTKQTLNISSGEINQEGIITTGTLVTDDGIKYPIIRGIPRFVNQEYYASSFGYEWNRWPRVQFDSENVGKPMAGYTSSMWEIITGAELGQVKDKMIVEFGCGSGRFLDIVRSKGGTAVGMDISQAVEAARQNFSHDTKVLIVQGDINNPPFREGVFDGGYSIGVLHHTPAPIDGLKELVNTVKSGGWVACCVYPKGEFYDYPSVERLRKIHNLLNTNLKYYPALFYSYLSAYVITPLIYKGKQIKVLSQLLENLEKNWLVALNLPDKRWRVLDVFDAITPAIATTHTYDEVIHWMQKAGCTDLKKTTWCDTSVIGIKSETTKTD